MGRIKPAYYYQRQLTIAEARDAYRVNNPPAPPTGPIVGRGASTGLFYRSLALTNGTDPLIFNVNVPNDTLALIDASQLGLLETLGAGEVSLRIRGSGLKPTKIHWYEGATTPTRTSTPWGSRVSKYYEDRHYSAPFSERTGVFTAAALRQNFLELFGVGGSERTLLGARNGRAWLELESAPISALT